MRVKAILLAAVCSFSVFAVPDADIPINAQDWNLPKEARVEEQDGKNVLVVEVTKAGGKIAASREFDIRPYRGHVVEFQYEAKATDVSEPSQDYNGVKLMVHYHSGATEFWPNRPGAVRMGTYDWKWAKVYSIIPKDAHTASFQIGLQNSSGKVEVRAVRIVDCGESRNVFGLKNHPGDGF